MGEADPPPPYPPPPGAGEGPGGSIPARHPPAIIIHALEHALAAASAAAALGCPLTLRSAPGAAGAAGAGWFAALKDLVGEQHPTLDIRWVLDCSDEAGTAQGALRRSIRHLRFDGPPPAAERLRALGAVIDDDDRPALDLLDLPDPEQCCREWLRAGG